MQDFFQNYLNKTVKVVYQDGPQVIVKTGTFLDFNHDFISLSIYGKDWAINRAQIIKIEEVEG